MGTESKERGDHHGMRRSVDPLAGVRRQHNICHVGRVGKSHGCSGGGICLHRMVESPAFDSRDGTEAVRHNGRRCQARDAQCMAEAEG